MPDQEYAATAVAVADLLDYEISLTNQAEGLLLVAGGADETVTPARVAQKIEVDRESVANLFRQLETADAVIRTSYVDTVVESKYRVQSNNLREVFSTTRQAIRIIEAYIERQPPSTEVTPLVTFPDDPAFADASPATFGMEQLLSVLASEIKSASDSIILIAPFFEGAGFDMLREVLADALERGVELTIVTRYLSDESSHNRTVIEDFVRYLEQKGVTDRIQAVDYTVWDEEVPLENRTQSGTNPSFTLHAKIMLFDETSAYVGSANVTDYGFDRYLELGALLRGNEVSRYRELCEFLLDSEGATVVEWW